MSGIVEKGCIPYISGSSVIDLYYICKRSGMEKAVILEKLKILMNAFEVLIIEKDSICEAIVSGFKDFEDAVQILAAKNGGIDLIITRNKTDFNNNWVKVLNPEEFFYYYPK